MIWPAAAPGRKKNKHRFACDCCFAFGEFCSRREKKSAATDELYLPSILLVPHADVERSPVSTARHAVYVAYEPSTRRL